MVLTREQYEENYLDVLEAIRGIKPEWQVWSVKQNAYIREPYPIDIKMWKGDYSGAHIEVEYLGWEFNIWSTEHNAIPGLPDDPKDVTRWGIQRIYPEQGCNQMCSVIVSYGSADSVDALVEYLTSEFGRTTDLVTEDY